MAIDTKQLFADAMLELLTEKPFEAITVKSLCASTGASRQTFYNHFLDKYDLLVWICRKQCRELWASFRQHRYPFRECMLAVYRLLYENQEFYRIVLGIDGPNSFRDFLYSLTYGYYRRQIEEHGTELDRCLEYAIRFTTIGTLEIAFQWVRDGYLISPEELVEYQLACCPGILRPFLDLEQG